MIFQSKADGFSTSRFQHLQLRHAETVASTRKQLCCGGNTPWFEAQSMRLAATLHVPDVPPNFPRVAVDVPEPTSVSIEPAVSIAAERAESLKALRGREGSWRKLKEDLLVFIFFCICLRFLYVFIFANLEAWHGSKRASTYCRFGGATCIIIAAEESTPAFLQRPTQSGQRPPGLEKMNSVSAAYAEKVSRIILGLLMFIVGVWWCVYFCQFVGKDVQYHSTWER